jgi:crossover junction endodeoxyribonuclease RuvC
MKTTRCSGEWISVTEHARVLGIDPGTRIAGYAVIDFNARGDSTLIDAGVLRLSATAPLAARIRQLFDDVTALLQEHSPTHMALEAVFSHADHARTAIQMAHARGVVLLAAELRGITVAELPPAEVKKALTGNGRATKPQMQAAAMVQCGLTTMPEPSDVADAIGIALCGGRRLRGVAS